MKHRLAFVALLVALTTAFVVTQTSAADKGRGPGRNVVFVQTNESAGNRILVFDPAMTVT